MEVYGVDLLVRQIDDKPGRGGSPGLDDSVSSDLSAEPFEPQPHSQILASSSIPQAYTSGSIPKPSAPSVFHGNPFKPPPNVADDFAYQYDDEPDEDEPFAATPYYGADGGSFPRYHDQGYAAAFCAHLFIVLVLALVCGIPNIRHLHFTHHSLSQGLAMLGIFVTTTAVSAAGSLLWLLIIETYGAMLIRAVMICTIIVLNVVAVFCFSQLGSGGFVPGLFFILLSLGWVFYYRSVKARIPFAAANLTIACQVIRKFPATLKIAVGAVLVQLFWVVLWAAAMLGVRGMIDGHETDNSAGATVSTLLMLISFFWAMEVIQNVVHCTTAGTVGEWWFSVSPKDAVKRSMIRAMTTSFGSICLGSLAVAALKGAVTFLRILEGKRKHRRPNQFVQAVRRLLAYFERMMEFFNKYAYCEISLYGKDFKSAGYDAMQLFRERGWTTLVNNDLVSSILTAGCVIVGGVAASSGAFTAYTSFRCSPEETAVSGECDVASTVFLAFVICGSIGFGLCSIVSSVIDSALCTIWVCFAQDPATLQLTHPNEFNALIDAWQRFHPDIISASGPAYAVLRV